jgi:hypothetical protein
MTLVIKFFSSPDKCISLYYVHFSERVKQTPTQMTSHKGLCALLLGIACCVALTHATCTRGRPGFDCEAHVIDAGDAECPFGGVRFVGVNGNATQCNADVTANALLGTYVVPPGSTRAALQTVINTASAAGGGEILLTSDITTDGTSIQMKSNVVLDGGPRYYSIKASADSTAHAIISNLAASIVGPYNLIANNTRGASNFSVSSLNITQFQAGDLALLTGGSLNGDTTLSLEQLHEICDVDTVTSALILCNPIVHDYLVTRFPLPVIRRIRPNAVQFGLRRLTLDMNGNTGGTTSLLQLSYTKNFRIEKIRLRGNSRISTMIPFWIIGTVDSLISDVHSRVTQTTTTRDISIDRVENTIIEKIWTKHTGGFGPNIDESHDSLVTQMFTMHQTGRGFRCDRSSDTQASHIFSSGHQSATSTGMFHAFGAMMNSAVAVTTRGTNAYGYSTQGLLDDNNVVLGLISSAHATGDVGMSALSNGNYILTKALTKTAAGVPIATLDGGANIIDKLGENTRIRGQTVSPLSARMTVSQLPDFNSIALGVRNDTWASINYKGSDGIVREALLPLLLTT